jgi:RNA polymerase sigma-70 factor (ECF subfamily)
MTQLPDTRYTLLARIRDSEDREAWHEFAEIYRPVIHRLACGKGLQHADAEDLTQQVLMSVARAIDRWQPDPAGPRFRSWLRRVADNAILNALSRRRGVRGSGDSSVQQLLQQQPSDGGPDSRLLRIEYRREVFRYAARQIRPEFQESTWRAFWLTAVESIDVDEVARRLGKARGAVYAARSRVMRRLREVVTTLDECPGSDLAR